MLAKAPAMAKQSSCPSADKCLEEMKALEVWGWVGALTRNLHPSSAQPRDSSARTGHTHVTYGQQRGAVVNPTEPPADTRQGRW